MGRIAGSQGAFDSPSRAPTYATLSPDSPVVGRIAGPSRALTYASLPPYSLQQQGIERTENYPQAKTPSKLLGLKVDHEEPQDTKFDPEKSMSLLKSDSVGPIPTFESPKTSPLLSQKGFADSYSSELDSEGALKALETRRNTNTEVAAAPDSIGIMHGSPSTFSSGLSRVFSSPSSFSTATTQSFDSPSSFSIVTSRKDFDANAITPVARQDSFFSLDAPFPEIKMDNLSGVQMYAPSCLIVILVSDTS